jgi:hypothetical protein
MLMSVATQKDKEQAQTFHLCKQELHGNQQPSSSLISIHLA